MERVSYKTYQIRLVTIHPISICFLILNYSQLLNYPTLRQLETLSLRLFFCRNKFYCVSKCSKFNSKIMDLGTAYYLGKLVI